MKILFGLIVIVLSLSCEDIWRIPIQKSLNVVINTNKPCFYIDSFDGVDEFDIWRIGVMTVVPPGQIPEYLCTVGVYELDSNRIKAFSLSSMIGINQCITYESLCNFGSSSSKKLQMDILYNITVEGIKKNLSTGKLKDGDEIYLHSLFNITKNKDTGNIEIH
jgi:hypothetical protein